ncbi:8981_t:CDS:2 [Gigaspora rosea]|nr:8981_t:CDS:2 [Gigaspora rosea]
MDLFQDDENDNYIPQSISHTNESEKDLELMHVDNNCSNMELEIIAKERNDNSSNKYITESADSFNESEKSEKPLTKERKKIGRCKVLVPANKGAKSKRKYGVLVHTQGSTTNFASF